jgi:NADH-quinone oxidoreductase subunit J
MITGLTGLVFFASAFVMIFSALLVILVRNTVSAAVFLALTFFCAAVLWMLMQAEFLSLVIIFVYVGAVMTLILFVVMMLNVEAESMHRRLLRYMPVAVIAAVVVLILMVHFLHPQHLYLATSATQYAADYSNTAALGMLLYTKYLFSFEMAAIILLIAIIGSISLVFVGRRQSTKKQDIARQHLATKASRLRIITFADKGHDDDN